MPTSRPGATVRDFDLLWDYNNPAATEAKFRQRLAEVRAQRDRDNEAYELELLTQIARTLGLQMKFDEAHVTLDEVERRMSDEQLGPVVRARYLLERGRVYNSSKHPGQAKPLFIAATDISMSGQLDNYAVDAMHMLAIVETEPAEQLRWNEQAVKLAEQSTDERARKWLGSLYNNIGWTYYESKRYDEALTTFRKAVEFREKAGAAGPVRIAHYCVGKTLRAVGRTDEALAIQRRLHEEATKANQPDGFICEEIAECLLAQGNPAEAKPYFKEAYEMLSKDEWLKRDEPARLERLRQFGE